MTTLHMMQDDSCQNRPIKELPVSQYDSLFTSHYWFIISQCEPSRTKRQTCTCLFHLYRLTKHNFNLKPPLVLYSRLRRLYK